MECEVPRREPWIFPLDHGARGLHRVDAVLVEPLVGVEEEVLLAPQHAPQRLADHAGCVFAGAGGNNGLVKAVRLALALFKRLVERWAKGFVIRVRAQPQLHDRTATWPDVML